ncbi:MAG: hypothetical protein SH850_25775 [Planctomycetaceae bacterium]|nr:hypothetical protein [Planctomycetaceae bacterium]
MIPLMLVVCAGVIGTIAGVDGNGPLPVQVKREQVVPRKATVIPDDVDYEIVDRYAVPKTKLSLDIRLNRRVSSEILKSIAEKTYESEHGRSYERVFLTFYLPGMEVDAGAWATAIFDPKLKVKIIGATEDFVAKLSNPTADDGRKLVGQWISDTGSLGQSFTIYRKGKLVFMDIQYEDGGISTHQLLERRQSGQQRFVKKENNSPDEYWYIDKQGELCLFHTAGVTRRFPQFHH